MKHHVLILALLWSSFSQASIFDTRQREAREAQKQAYIQQELSRFQTSNAGYKKFLHKFADRHGGLVDGSTCKVGTGYYMDRTPLTPSGSAEVSVDSLDSIAGATWDCKLNLANGLACRVTHDPTMGEMGRQPKRCKGQKIRIWAFCYDSARQESFDCL